jgi:hypothetical protein
MSRGPSKVARTHVLGDAPFCSPSCASIIRIARSRTPGESLLALDTTPCSQGTEDPVAVRVEELLSLCDSDSGAR